MKNYRIFRALSGWLLTASLFSAPRIPVEDFAREPDASRAQLSPDGKRLAFIRQHDEINKLHVTVLDSKEISRLNLGSATLANGAERELGEYSWISNERLLITTVIWDKLFGVLATNWDGTQSAAISGLEDGRVSLQDSKLWSREVIHRFNDPGQHVLMLDRREDGYGIYNSQEDYLGDPALGRSRGRVVKGIARPFLLRRCSWFFAVVTHSYPGFLLLHSAGYRSLPLSLFCYSEENAGPNELGPAFSIAVLYYWLTRA
jgi:hypothetical protein